MDDNLSKQYHKLTRKHRNVVQEYLDTLGLYIGQPRFLFELAKTPGISQGELSTSLNISKETVSVTLKRLETGDFIVRKQSEKDKRIKFLFLSKKGEKVIVELRENFDQINNSMFSRLDSLQKEHLEELFSLMISGLEKGL
ncbi:MAG: MarR family transcriptional regulator [Erysipelothrix sp.]|nr:MarR family transcriptional regulator [Erysipelothrix sp.]